VLIAVSTATLWRLALAIFAARLRPVVPIALLLGLAANLAMFLSVLRYSEGGETESWARWAPLTGAHLAAVIGYGAMVLVYYRQRGAVPLVASCSSSPTSGSS
jgi:Na+/H+ antiporter NhaA